MQYNENKYITLTRINDINYYLKKIKFQKYSRTGQAKISVLMQHNENQYIILARI